MNGKEERNSFPAIVAEAAAAEAAAAAAPAAAAAVGQGRGKRKAERALRPKTKAKKEKKPTDEEEYEEDQENKTPTLATATTTTNATRYGLRIPNELFLFFCFFEPLVFPFSFSRFPCAFNTNRSSSNSRFECESNCRAFHLNKDDPVSSREA